MKRWAIRVLVAVLGLLALAVVVLALMRLRPDAGMSRSSIEIAAPREQLCRGSRRGQVQTVGRLGD
jgi:hypothetical protein